MEIFKDVSTAVAAIIALIYIVRLYSQGNGQMLSLMQAGNEREKGFLKALDGLSDTISNVGSRLAVVPDEAAAAYRKATENYYDQVLKDHQNILKSQNLIADAVAPISIRLSEIDKTINLANAGAMEWHKSNRESLLKTLSTSDETLINRIGKLQEAIEPKLDSVIETVKPLPEVREHLQALAKTLEARDEANRQWFDAQQKSNAELRGELVQILTRIPLIDDKPTEPPPNLLPPGSMPATEKVADTHQEVTGVQ